MIISFIVLTFELGNKFQISNFYSLQHLLSIRQKAHNLSVFSCQSTFYIKIVHKNLEE